MNALLKALKPEITVPMSKSSLAKYFGGTHFNLTYHEARVETTGWGPVHGPSGKIILAITTK